MNLPLRIGVISTVFYPLSHTDVILSRWVNPRETDKLYGWTGSNRTRVVSIYVDQASANDLTLDFCNSYGVRLHKSIGDTLTNGGQDLAVDAILIIGEHGDYPTNSIGQKLYPRKEFFDQVLEVFRKHKRCVPIFFDKHLSWNPEWCLEMHQQIKKNDIPFFGGSSISHCPIEPNVEIPSGRRIQEVVSVYWDSLEHYLFHSLEFVQSVVENRQGGETGLQSITAWKAKEVWAAMDRGDFSKNLLEQAAQAVSNQALTDLQALIRCRDSEVHAFQLNYVDGLKVTHFMHPKAIPNWAVSLIYDDDSQPVSFKVQTGGHEHFYPHFARLNKKIEEFFLTKQSPVQINRLLFTSLATAYGMKALSQSGIPLALPNFEMT